MSQRIEKGPKFTPAMGGMAARRRAPAAGPSSSQPPKAPPPSTTSASPGPSQHHDQQHQQQRPTQSKPASGSGSMAPPPPRKPAARSTSTQPSEVAPSSSPRPIARPSNSPHPAPAPAPTRSYASSSSSSPAFAPGASRAAGEPKKPQADPQPSSSSSSTASGATQRRESTSSTSAFKPPNLSSSATRPSSTSNGSTSLASEAEHSPPADVSNVTLNKQASATARPLRSTTSKSSTDSSQSQSQPQSRAAISQEIAPPSQQIDPVTSEQTTVESQAQDQPSSHNDDNAVAIDAALAHLRKTSAVQQQSGDSQQHNQFAPHPQQPPQSLLPSADSLDDAAQPSAAATPGPSRPKDKPSAKRSRRAPLPDGHPPKPLSAYFLFLAGHRDLVRQDYPDASVSQVAKLCGEKWRNLSSKEKSTYEEQAAVRKHQYEQELQVWKDRTPNWEELVSRSAAEANSDDDEEREGEVGKRRKQSSRSRRRRGPKRPPSAYLLYAQEQRRAVTTDKAKETFAETNKRIGDSWRVLPLATKEEYLAKSQELKKQYEIDLAKWQEDHPDDGDTDESETETQGSGSEPGRKRRRKGGGGRPRVEGKSITDEEKEYEALVAEHGENLASLRLQTSNTNMSDLTTAEYRHGVASKRTFELDRVRQKQLEDAFALRTAEKQRVAEKRRMIKENLKKSRDGSEVVLPKYDAKTDPSAGRRNAFNVLPGPHNASQSQSSSKREESGASAEKSSADVDEEVVSGDEDDVEEELGGRPQDKARQRDHLKVPGLDDSEDEEGESEKKQTTNKTRSKKKSATPAFRGENTDEEEVNPSDAESDAGSMRSGTSVGTHHSLRDNASAPQMRIVNGEIVLDETSLQVNRSGGGGLDDEPHDEDDVLEEVATHKFVNTATNSKRQKVSRWTLKETEEFFKAVSMWGTDFEMISRMFPNRTRKQIKSKWTKEERGNPSRLNNAFARKIPVNLTDYAIMANVDLSGPPPQVVVNGKTEADLAIFKQDDAVDEEGAEDSTTRVKKASQTPDPFARRGGSQGPSQPASTADDLHSRSGGKKSKQSEREQRKLRERARRSGRVYDVEEEIVDEAPPE